MIFAVCKTLEGGYKTDQKFLRESGIKVGDRIEMDSAQIREGGETLIWLNGYDGHFNAMYFKFETPQGEIIDLHSIYELEEWD